MPNIVYIPGFNESSNTFKTLNSILGDGVKNISLPGHRGENEGIPFSMTSTRKLVEEMLKKSTGESGMITTSLSVWPILEALRNTRNSIQKLLLISPAYDPFMTVVHMFQANPLIQGRGNKLRKPSDFLQEDRTIYNAFLGGNHTNGDSETFQQDLQRFSDMGYAIESEFLERIRALKEKSISVKILANRNDRIITGRNQDDEISLPVFFQNPHNDIDLSLGSRISKNVKQEDYSSHIPVFSDANKAMISNFFRID